MDFSFPTYSLAFGAPGIQEILIILIIPALCGLWLWSLIHCCLNKKLSDQNRIIGIVLIALLSVIGSLIYLFLPRKPSDW